MKKLALSVVILMVAGAGASVGAVGCSSSSSGTTADDSGVQPDVTQGDDSGTTAETGTETSTDDSGTVADTGTAAMCDFDAAGSVAIQGPDGGDNTTCEACIAMNCGQSQCVCLSDTNMAALPDDAGNVPACGAYVNCLYNAAEQALPDAGIAGLSALLPGFEAACGMGLQSSSTTAGNAFVGCFVMACASSCL